MAHDRDRSLNLSAQLQPHGTKDPNASMVPSSRFRPSLEDPDAQPHHRSTQSPVVLPSLMDARHGPWGSQGPSARPGSGDPRYASPNAVNGFPPPSIGQQQQPSGGYLPPLQPQTDHRASPGGRTYSYDDRQPATGAHHHPPHHPPSSHPPPGPHHPHPQHYPEQYASHDHYYYSRGHPQGAAPAVYQQDYRGHPSGYPQDYASAPGDRPREAPRQRTSIACRYCRKRKIRCSGHQNAPGGKCQNCARMNQECIFQPVSSSSSGAFIPVSAVPGGVPPGTQLFGAYGQPLAPGTIPTQPPPPPPPQPHSYPPTASHHPGYYHHAVQSPTDSYYGEPRGDDPMAGRRRRRTPEEREEGYRLPPPRASGYSDEDSRRRSPAEFSGDSSPGSLNYRRFGESVRYSPRNSALPQPSAGAGGGEAHRSPVVGSGSSGSSTPHRQGHPPPAQTQSSVMSLSNLVEKTDIDRTMIDRLNRPRDPFNVKREPSR